MDDDALKKIEARIQELPKDVQAAVLSNDFEEQVAKIGQSNRLHIDQIGELGDEVLLVMLGFASAEGFAERIQRKLHLYNDQAAAIATQINEEVFLSIRESMKKFQEDQKRAAHPATIEAVPVAVTTPPPPASAAKTSSTAPVNAADMMLSQKTVSISTAPKIGSSYKTDPYREPTE